MLIHHGYYRIAHVCNAVVLSHLEAVHSFASEPLGQPQKTQFRLRQPFCKGTRHAQFIIRTTCRISYLY